MPCWVAQLCLTFCDPKDCKPARLLYPWDSPGKNAVLGCYALLQGIFPTQGLSPGSYTAGDSLPSEPPGKPKNTGVGSLSLLQGIFVTQELNWGLLRIRQILYQLSHQGSLPVTISAGKTNFWHKSPSASIFKKCRDLHGSLMVRTSPSNAEDVGLIPGQGTGIPHASWPGNQNMKQKQCCNTFNKDFKNGPHPKKKKS